MKVIVCATHKGGEGKTTTSINLAEFCALIQKKRVLLLDLDSQGNCSGRYLALKYDTSSKGKKIPPIHPDYESESDSSSDGRSTIADIYYGLPVLPYSTMFENLEIMPAHSKKLEEAEAVTIQSVAEKVHHRLKEFIEKSELEKYYDVVIIDTPPSKGPLTVSAIKAATDLIIPAQMEQFSIEGILGMLQLWKSEAVIRSQNSPLNLVGILPNRYKKNLNLHENFLSDLKNMDGIKDHLIPYEMRNRAIYSEVLVENASPKSVFELPINHPARKECQQICEYIMEKVYG